MNQPETAVEAKRRRGRELNEAARRYCMAHPSPAARQAHALAGITPAKAWTSELPEIRRQVYLQTGWDTLRLVEELERLYCSSTGRDALAVLAELRKIIVPKDPPVVPPATTYIEQLLVLMHERPSDDLRALLAAPEE